jgi:GntR family transcriptional regulator
MINTALKIVTGTIPKYRQVLQILRNQILSGELPPDAQLPTEEELSATYGVSRGTVRKAIAQLEAERLIRTEQGLGSFVRSVHPNVIPFHFTTSGTPPAYADSTLTFQVLAQEVVPAPLDIAERLRLSPGTAVIHIARLHLADGRPIAHTRRYLPESLCPSLINEDLTTQSVHRLLVANSELPLLRAEIELEAHSLTLEEADLLMAALGTSAIVVNRLTYTAPNRPAVWYRGIFRDAYTIGVQVGEAGPAPL